MSMPRSRHPRPIRADRIELWIYKVANPVVKALLRSPLHRIASGNVALLHFRGRKSGREFVTPLSYAPELVLVEVELD